MAVLLIIVALRKESVDRNEGKLKEKTGHDVSLSARRAWIEIAYIDTIFDYLIRRSPQGERG